MEEKLSGRSVSSQLGGVLSFICYLLPVVIAVAVVMGAVKSLKLYAGLADLASLILASVIFLAGVYIAFNIENGIKDTVQQLAMPDLLTRKAGIQKAPIDVAVNMSWGMFSMLCVAALMALASFGRRLNVIGRTTQLR